MRLIVGLGNPGRQYARNRHNIGFMAVEAIAQKNALGPFRKAFQGLYCEGRIAEVRLALLTPQTFMNESGRAVGEACRFHKIAPEDVIVIHDELDLASGKVRIKVGGGNAGHNGLRSVSAHIGNEYKRVRVGIGHPGDKSLVHSYVLSDFSKAEMDWVENLCDSIARNVDLLLNDEDAAMQNRIHLAMAAAGFAAATKE
jgi:peptidyl-tRNA hydrolase, PTH1 family